MHSPLPPREGPERLSAAKPGRGRGIPRARALRKLATVAEQKLWEMLRRKQVHGLRFRRQYPIGPYFADFVCLPARLIVELDGGQHAEDNALEYDRRRTAWLESQRFRVLRFWNLDVFENIDGVMDRIADAVKEPLPLTPSRKGRGKAVREAERH
ncbi:MAG: endonuclease domain-containing protein [Alphaproteobacteria bacterium]|nr:endonuclease domain-containing protein [Alphaproteobacteria bacterium]